MISEREREALDCRRSKCVHSSKRGIPSCMYSINCEEKRGRLRHVFLYSRMNLIRKRILAQFNVRRQIAESYSKSSCVSQAQNHKKKARHKVSLTAPHNAFGEFGTIDTTFCEHRSRAPASTTPLLPPFMFPRGSFTFSDLPWRINCSLVRDG